MIEIILEVFDEDFIQILELLKEKEFRVSVNTDEAVGWIGDSCLEALFRMSSLPDELMEDMMFEIPTMVHELEFILSEGGRSKLDLLDNLRLEFFREYVREKVGEIYEARGVESILKKQRFR